MMSKSSFLVNMKENNKRRVWVWAISILAFVFAFPTYTALVIDRIVSRAEWIIEDFGEEAGQQILHDNLIFGMRNTLGFSVLIMVITTGIALISAVQGFSYLYSRKKIDFYMGMPIKRKKRFLNIWLNGILIYLIPYLLGLLISMLIAAGNGGVDKTVVYAAFISVFINIFYYLSIYHIVILAVMLTGNMIITGFGVLVLGLYEFVVRVVLVGYKSLFFQYFSSYGMETLPVLSPITMYMNLADIFNDQNIIAFKYMTGLLLFTVIIGLLAYLCYLKRPAEAAGKALAFEWMKTIIKILLVVPMALLSGLIMAETINFVPQTSMKRIGYVIFAIIFVVLIGSALIQVIYEFDIKGALHKKSHIVICGILTALIFISFRYDLTGYDHYIPEQKNIESIAFVPDYYDVSARGNLHFDSDGTYMSDLAYADKYMHLKNVEDICKLVETSMNEYNEFMRQVNQNGYDENQTEYWSYATLIYHMKNGRSVSRAVWINVNDEKIAPLLDSVIGSEEFKKGYLAGASENLDTILAETNTKRQISATYGNDIYTKKMSEADAKSFLEIYRKDLALFNFSNVRESKPWAVFCLNMEEDISGGDYWIWNGISRTAVTRSIGMNIYPFYKESIAWLTEHGYYMDYQLNADDVDRIQVINHNSKERAKKETYGEDEIDTRVYVDYTQKEDIAQIASCVYPDNIVYSFDWDGGKEYDSDYEIIVYFKADSDINRNYGTNAYYYFLEDQIPDFVIEDTLYQ